MRLSRHFVNDSLEYNPKSFIYLGFFLFQAQFSAHHPPTAAPLHPQSMARQQVAQRAGGPAETTWAQGWAAAGRAEAVIQLSDREPCTPLRE